MDFIQIYINELFDEEVSFNIINNILNVNDVIYNIILKVKYII